jgi:hypothetical protein
MPTLTHNTNAAVLYSPLTTQASPPGLPRNVLCFEPRCKQFIALLLLLLAWHCSDNKSTPPSAANAETSSQDSDRSRVPQQTPPPYKTALHALAALDFIEHKYGSASARPRTSSSSNVSREQPAAIGASPPPSPCRPQRRASERALVKQHLSTTPVRARTASPRRSSPKRAAKDVRRAVLQTLTAEALAETSLKQPPHTATTAHAAAALAAVATTLTPLPALLPSTAAPVADSPTPTATAAAELASGAAAAPLPDPALTSGMAVSAVAATGDALTLVTVAVDAPRSPLPPLSATISGSAAVEPSAPVPQVSARRTSCYFVCILSVCLIACL